MKKTISRHLIMLLCLVIASLAVGIGLNFVLNQRFDYKIEEEKRIELDKHLQGLVDEFQSVSENEITGEFIEGLFYALVESGNDFRVGYIDRSKEIETIVHWDVETGRPETELPHAMFSKEFEKERTGKRLSEVLRERDKIRSTMPVFHGDEVIGMIWIEDSIISDIRTFVMVRILTAFAVLFSLIAGILGTGYIIRKLIRDVNRINEGVEIMKDDLSYRIEVSSDELGQVAREINKMAEQLQEQKRLKDMLHQADKMAALGQFVSGIAHELRNPLGIMKGSIQLMEREGTFSDEQSEFLGIVKEQIERQNLVIEELLRFAKPTEPDFETLDIEDVLDSIMTFAGAYVRDSHVELSRSRSMNLQSVYGDSEKLKQVFLNLILNAVQAMPDGGILSIETEMIDESRLAVRFADSGKGMSESDLADIFNPYFTTKAEGTGLGLSISYQLIQLHGGTIKAENLAEGGAVFTVMLPAQKA
ncbi:MAG: HAMP domain-containing protein [Peptostreptococcaceae bacterium]|nr:HAMP domain-containing protein [Peptostreptococcaceae bacterium]